MSAAEDRSALAPVPRPTFLVIKGGAQPKPKKGLPPNWHREPTTAEAPEPATGPGASHTRVVSALPLRWRDEVRFARRSGLPISWVTLAMPPITPTIAPDARWLVSRERIPVGHTPCVAPSLSRHGETPCRNPVCVAAEQERQQAEHAKRVKSTFALRCASYFDEAAADFHGRPVHSPWRFKRSRARYRPSPRRVERAVDAFVIESLIESLKKAPARRGVDRDDLLGETYLELVNPTAKVAASEKALSQDRMAKKARERAYWRLRAKNSV